MCIRVLLVVMTFFLYQCVSLKIGSIKTNLDDKALKQSLSMGAPQGLNAFVDISHRNSAVDLKTAKKAGLVGFFHKATQGVHFVDPKYGERVAQGRTLDLYIGAYHFGTAEPVEDQVTAFLSAIDKYGSQLVLPVLDWEDNPVAAEGTMSKEQAKQFITLFQQKTGVYPVVYGGYWMLYELRNEQDISVFAHTPLWQGFYSAKYGYLDGIWKTWSFLQYTDGHLGPEPHAFEGIGNVDRDVFNGTLANLKTFWQQHALKSK